MKQVVVRLFECRGSGQDCPAIGFEVVQVKGLSNPRKRTCLLETDLERLRADKVKVVVVK